MREPETGDQLLVLSFDYKGIAMRREDLREAMRKKAKATPRPLHSRLTKGEKLNRKRMSKVAAVYSLDPWPRTIADVLHGLHDPKELDAKPPRPVNKRVWASVEHLSQEVIDAAFNEGLRRDPERSRRWVVPVDGHRDQINRVRVGGATVSEIAARAKVAQLDWAAITAQPRVTLRRRRGARSNPAAAPRLEDHQVIGMIGAGKSHTHCKPRWE